MQRREENMKHKFIITTLSAVLLAICLPAAWAQTGSVRGVVKDASGTIMPGLQVQYQGTENGRKYSLKTDKKGEYFSLGIALGTYDIKVFKDGQQIYFLNHVPVKLGEVQIDIKLDKPPDDPGAQAGAPAPSGPAEMTQEQKQQLKQKLDTAKKADEERSKVKGLNDKLSQAGAAEQAGNLDQAITIMNEAIALDPTRDVLWSKLAEFERLAAKKATDPAQRTAYSEKAIEHYQKAIELAPPEKPETAAAYYNNMGQAYDGIKKSTEAVAAYEKAAQLAPTNAGQFYFNIGAILTNTGKVDEAIAAFDKALAIDPNNADAYYWKGVNMVGKASLKDGKMKAPDGTAEAFNKYLELQPTGQFAGPAKSMLDSIGAEVQTQFGKARTPARKK
jgi:tetratricopeptide (TPR) repeat protein